MFVCELVSRSLSRIKDVKVLDTKCPPTAGCWFCEDACVNCMKLSVPGFTSVTVDGLSIQFCSKECAECFTGKDVPLQVSAILVNPLPSECHGDHKLMFSISAFARGGGKGTKFSFNFYQYTSPKQTTDEPVQYCAHYRVRQLFSQQLSEFLISSEAKPLKQLVCTSPEVFTSNSSYSTVELYLLEAVKILFSCHERFLKMDSCSESMPIYLDCPDQLVSQVRASAVCSEVVHHLLSSVNSYKIVSEVSQEWSKKQIISLLHCIDSFKLVMENSSCESSELILSSLISLQIETIAGTYSA